LSQKIFPKFCLNFNSRLGVSYITLSTPLLIGQRFVNVKVLRALANLFVQLIVSHATPAIIIIQLVANFSVSGDYLIIL